MVPAENIHMTLRFLGDVDASQQGALEARLAEFVFEPVTLTLDCAGYWSRAGILWLGPRKRRALSVSLYSDFRTNFVPWDIELMDAVSRRM